ncbi:MAG: heme exporter protein CcmB [Alphaproteobacteria bacterium]
MDALLAIVARDLLIARRQGGATLLVVAFFVITVTLFPLGVGPEAVVLARIASGVVWVAALLATLIALDRMFQADWEDGGLELLALAGPPLELVVLAKALAHWLSSGLPLIVAAPVLALALQMDPAGLVVLVVAMGLGTPILSLVGAIGAALTVGMRRGGVLLSLLVLPLYLPVLIFGVAASEAAILELSPRPHLLLLGAGLLGSIALAPWAAAAGLRISLE